MIIKVQNDSQQDRFLVEAAYIRWDYVATGTTYAILEFYIVATQSRTAGTINKSSTGIEADPSLRLRIYHGDRVFVMNNEGKTIDSRHINLENERSGANKIDLCDSCIRQGDCTISAGRTTGCIRFQPIGRE